MDVHERTAPDPLRRGGPNVAARTLQRTAAPRILGAVAPIVNDSWHTRRDYGRLEGLAVFAVFTGAALYLAVHVLAASLGWQTAAIAMALGEWLTLLYAALMAAHEDKR